MIKGKCITVVERKGRKEILCNKVFKGKTKDEITERWSKHNDTKHANRLGTHSGCVLTFDEKKCK